MYVAFCDCTQLLSLLGYVCHDVNAVRRNQLKARYLMAIEQTPSLSDDIAAQVGMYMDVCEAQHHWVLHSVLTRDILVTFMLVYSYCAHLLHAV